VIDTRAHTWPTDKQVLESKDFLSSDNMILVVQRKEKKRKANKPQAHA
jgi:hypothetical protein